MTGPLKKLKEKVTHSTGSGDKTSSGDDDDFQDAVAGDETATEPQQPQNHDANVEIPQFRLRITAGPDYDKSTQRLVKVNGPSITVSDEVKLAVRIKDYSGFPEGSPSTSACFESNGVHAKDTFSIAFAITPREDIKTEHLHFGLDTGENPIRKFGLPSSLVNTAIHAVTYFVDGSLVCDSSSDQPSVMGPLLTGTQTLFSVGDVVGESSTSTATWDAPGVDMEEGGTESGLELRDSLGIPADDASKRRKYFSKKGKGDGFVLEAGRTYSFDHGHGYIDWKECALKLPGFNFNILKHIGKGGKSHKVRFVLKDVESGEVYFVVMCTLLAGEDLRMAMEDDQKRMRGERGEDAVVGPP